VFLPRGVLQDMMRPEADDDEKSGAMTAKMD